MEITEHILDAATAVLSVRASDPQHLPGALFVFAAMTERKPAEALNFAARLTYSYPGLSGRWQVMVMECESEHISDLLCDHPGCNSPAANHLDTVSLDPQHDDTAIGLLCGGHLTVHDLRTTLLHLKDLLVISPSTGGRNLAQLGERAYVSRSTGVLTTLSELHAEHAAERPTE